MAFWVLSTQYGWVAKAQIRLVIYPKMHPNVQNLFVFSLFRYFFEAQKQPKKAP